MEINMPINEAWYKNVSERICIYMKEKNLSSEQLAELTGLSTRIIEQWLNGSFQNRSLIELEKIAGALSADPNFLIHQ